MNQFHKEKQNCDIKHAHNELVPNPKTALFESLNVFRATSSLKLTGVTGNESVRLVESSGPVVTLRLSKNTSDFLSPPHRAQTWETCTSKAQWAAQVLFIFQPVFVLLL